MTLTLSQATIGEDPTRGIFVRLQDTSKYVDVRVSIMAFERNEGGLTNDVLLRAFEPHRAKVELLANQRYDAGEYEEDTARKIIWFIRGSM